jgi:hypothetical protein
MASILLSMRIDSRQESNYYFVMENPEVNAYQVHEILFCMPITSSINL